MVGVKYGTALQQASRSGHEQVVRHNSEEGILMAKEH